MTWNYRVFYDEVVLTNQEREGYFTIREAYYDDADQVVSWTDEPCYPQGYTWIELANDLGLFSRATALPIIDITSGTPVECSVKDLGTKAGFGGSPMARAEERGYDG